MQGRLIGLSFALIVLVLISGCARESGSGNTAARENTGSLPEPLKKYVIGATIDRLDNDYFVMIKEGIEARCKELGIEANVQDARGRDDVQIKQLETFINQKVDAIIVAAVNDNVPGVERAVKKATERGIKVVAQSQKVATADAYVSIEQEPYGLMGGRMAGEWIRDNLDGKAEVAIMALPERPTIIQRHAGLKKGLLEVCPGARIVATPQAPNASKARSNMEAALQQHPGIQVVVSFNDDTALAAAAAIKAKMGKQASKAAMKYAVFGLDAIPQARAALKDPDSPFRGSVDIDPVGNGSKDVDIAVALIEGKELGTKKRTPSGSIFVDVEMYPVWAEKGK